MNNGGIQAKKKKKSFVFENILPQSLDWVLWSGYQEICAMKVSQSNQSKK